MKWKNILYSTTLAANCLLCFLLIFYDTQYPQASYLKYFLAGVTLIIGIKEFFLLLKKSDQIA